MTVGNYRGVDYGYDNKRSEYYFMDEKYRPIYHPDEEGLFSLIDKELDRDSLHYIQEPNQFAEYRVQGDVYYKHSDVFSQSIDTVVEALSEGDAMKQVSKKFPKKRFDIRNFRATLLVQDDDYNNALVTL